jgi:hypothetical protein
MTEITLRVNGQNQRVAVDDPNTPYCMPCTTISVCAAPSSVVDLANAALVASLSRVD